MSDDRRVSYWHGALLESLGEHGISATKEQIEKLAKDCAAIAFDCSEFDQTHAGGGGLSDARFELEKLKREFAAEQAKVGCAACNGKGRLLSIAGSWVTDSPCTRCGGAGKHAPGVR